MQANVESGCCVSNTAFHRRCPCDNILDQTQCESLCSNDSGCKGYVMLESSPRFCQLATTSLCPINCSDPYDLDNIGSIDPNGNCGYSSDWNGGCWIKKGILLHTSIFFHKYYTLSVYREYLFRRVRMYLSHVLQFDVQLRGP